MFHRRRIWHGTFTCSSSRTISFWYGAHSRKELFYVDELRRLEEKHPNFKFHIALSEPRMEDNWNILNFTGFIHNVVFKHFIGNHPALQAIEFQLCGPL